MKLKTLKDLGMDENSLIKRERIKAEAIKWVKYHCIQFECGECKDGEHFMKFHNITEADLK